MVIKKNMPAKFSPRSQKGGRDFVTKKPGDPTRVLYKSCKRRINKQANSSMIHPCRLKPFTKSYKAHCYTKRAKAKKTIDPAQAEIMERL